MSYIQESLASSEKLIYTTRPHWIVFGPCATLFVAAFAVWFYLPQYLPISQPLWHGYAFHQLLAALVLVVAVIAFIRAYVFYVTTEYGVTTRRVIMKKGWLQRGTIEVFLQRIEGMSINQTFFGRLFNYGTIIVIGTGGSCDYYPNVPFPVRFHRAVQQQMADQMS